MPRISESTRAKRRTAILEAAVHRFARRGYHDTTMADVAVEAGVSKGTPYLYFPSKQALFITLHDEWSCGLTARVDQTIEDLPQAARRSPRRVLGAVTEAVGAHVTDHPDRCRVLMEASTLSAYDPAIAEAVRTSDAQTLERLESLFRAGVQAGQWAATPPPMLRAQLYMATLYGLMGEWHTYPGSFSWTEASDALTAGQS